MQKKKMNIHIKAFGILSVCFLVVGCMSSSSPNSPTTKTGGQKEAKWSPLIEGSDLLVDSNSKYYPKEMKLNNGMLLRDSEWNEYLKDYLISLPTEKRDPVFRGLTRYYSEYDKVDKIIRFSPLRYISGPYHGTSYVSAMGAISGEQVRASLKIQYHGSSWLFVDRIKVVAGNFEWNSPSLPFRRDNYTEVWEYAYLDLKIPEYRKLADEIIKNDKVIIRFYGKQYYRDFTVSQRMKDDLNAILKTVDSLNQI